MLHIGHQREDSPGRAGHRAGGLEGNKLTQEDSFVYLGKALCGDGKTEKEPYVGLGLRRRAQAGANTWRAVEGVIVDRRISK